jgi:pyridoxine 5-phosphate synthase
MTPHLRLGVNIDHVATIRNARGGRHPDPVRAAELAVRAGADGITAHLREDRRHISDEDITRLGREVDAPLNLEMAATDEMLRIALRHQPHAVCLVPERREERTTEGGLDAVAGAAHIGPFIDQLSAAGIRITLFVEPSMAQVEGAAALGAHAVELHTGAWCRAGKEGQAKEIGRIKAAASCADRVGIECHAGHGLTYENVGPVAAVQQIVELNIGHFLIGEAIFLGLEESIARMRALMDGARGGLDLIGQAARSSE